MDFNFHDMIPEEIETLINAAHDKYETAHGTPCCFNQFCFTARQQGELIGVVSGYTAYAEVYIDDILVFSEYRGHGVGKQLLEQVYETYKNSGFDNVNLCTSKFQAPIFYEKCGFHLEFVRKNRNNPKLDKYFYVKYFTTIA